MENKLEMVAPCLFGLESVLKFELSRIGAENIVADNGRVSFAGDYTTLVKANLHLRTAERILVVLGEFTATSFEELFDKTQQLPFEDFIGEFDEFPVKGWSLDSQLASVSSCQSIIKKAAVKRLESVYHRSHFEETGALYQISFSIHKNMVTMMLDSTGTALYKRGYRQLSNDAPIRETLAAGIIDFARVSTTDKVYDPTCGSGTLLIEAAQRVLNIAPGLNREFSSEAWQQIPLELWKNEREQAKNAINTDVKFKAYGSDIDPETIKIAKHNAKKAGVSDYIEFTVADVANFSVNGEGIVVSNPPYGERLETDTVEFYNTMGTVMPKKPGVFYYIIAPTDEFEHNFGRKADRRRKLYNGMLECQLYMYYK